IVDTVKEAGPDACPPYVIGVGIGGTADYAGFLAKKALLLKVTPQSRAVDVNAARLERELESRINKLGIGPMGLGGKSTVLAVRILTHPTHIAGLPVAVNISCHALRSASLLL
ncbi:MAG: fumarate hydratase, partial [Candidatus Omnitrophica bacterium]|nr:fumarate hydratase [Candidatus Omnitrophota bacterium]